MKRASTYFIIGAALLVSVFALAYTGALNFDFASETSDANTPEAIDMVAGGESMAPPPNNILLGLNYSVFSETPKLGQPFNITISYGLVSNVAGLDGAYILVEFPDGLEYVNLSPTGHISFPFAPDGVTPSPEIIIDPMDGKRKMKIYFIDDLASGSAGDIIIQAVIPGSNACPLDEFITGAVSHVPDPNNPGAEITLPSLPSNVTVIPQGDNEWDVSLIGSVAVCGPCPDFGATVAMRISADNGHVPMDYATASLQLPPEAFNIVCATCTDVNTTTNVLTWEFGTQGDNSDNYDVPSPANYLEYYVTYCLPGPAGQSFPMTVDLNGEPRIACTNLPEVMEDGALSLTTPTNPSTGVSCLGVSISGDPGDGDEIGDNGIITANFLNSGQTCLTEMVAEVTVPEIVDVTGIPSVSYLQTGVNVLVTFMDDLGNTGTVGSYVTNTNNGAFNQSQMDAALATTGGNYFTKFTFTYTAAEIAPGFGPVALKNNGPGFTYVVRDTDRVGNPVVGANPRIPGGDLDSCDDGINTQGYDCLNTTFNLGGTDLNGDPTNDCDKDDSKVVRIPPEGINRLNKNLIGVTDYRPGQEAMYQINFKNCAYEATGVRMYDILDPKFSFDPSTVNYSTNLSDINDAPGSGFAFTATTLGDGSTLLSWVWTSFPDPSPARCTEEYSITYRVGIPDGTPPGEIPNCVVVDWDQSAGDVAMHPNGDPVIDPTPQPDIAGNMFPAYPPEGCNTQLTIIAVAETEASKGVKTSCEPGYPNVPFVYYDTDIGDTDPDNGVVTTYPGGEATYQLRIENTGNVPIGDMVFIDIFPWEDDEAVALESDRESDYRLHLVELIIPDPQFAANIDIFYTVEQNPCRPELERIDGPYNPTGCTTPTNWMTTPPADLTTIKAIKIEFKDGFTLDFGDIFFIEMKMQVPNGTPQGLVAWNSFAYQGARADPEGMGRKLPVAEPTKVGVRVECEPALTIGNFVWLDNNYNGMVDATDGDGIQDPGEPGVNGVKATLWSSTNGVKGDGDDMIVGMTETAPDINGNDGYYLFNVETPAPNDPLFYYVVFDYSMANLPPLTIPTAYNAGGDAVDSDVDPTMPMGTDIYMSDLVGTYTGLEIPSVVDLDIDMGLIPQTICELVPTVRIICDNKGTPGTGDDSFTYVIQVDQISSMAY
jgi:hypothetical protein